MASKFPRALTKLPVVKSCTVNPSSVSASVPIPAQNSVEVGLYATAPKLAANRDLNLESVSRLRKRRWSALRSCLGLYGSISKSRRTGDAGATKELHDANCLECSMEVTPDAVPKKWLSGELPWASTCAAPLIRLSPAILWGKREDVRCSPSSCLRRSVSTT